LGRRQNGFHASGRGGNAAGTWGKAQNNQRRHV
jgi:hypothetical protein